jgi:hypothetical protein
MHNYTEIEHKETEKEIKKMNKDIMEEETWRQRKNESKEDTQRERNINRLRTKGRSR